jgi:RNAse (barnase) inhibitor barstar
MWLTANKLEYFIVKEIILDADGWKSQEDFFIALLPKLGAPDWHGHNLDALWDSLVAGQINSTKSPYFITIINADKIPDILVAYLVKFEKLVIGMQAEGADIQVKFVPLLRPVVQSSKKQS